MRTLLAILVIFNLAAATALAQERWVFVPAAISGSEPPSSLATTFEAAFAQPVLANRGAAVEVETRHSSEAAVLGDQEMKRLLTIVGKGTSLIAIGRRKEGDEALKQLDSLSGPVRDLLQRDPARAQRLFNACVETGRLMLADEQPDEAHKQLVGCVRVFPGFTLRRPAPALRAAFVKASSQVEAEPHGQLDVRGGAGCAVRINGALLGRSPLHVPAVRVGSARIQLECERNTPGRIHGLGIQLGDNYIDIDPQFERALRTKDSALSLVYPDEATRERQMMQDAEQLGDIVGAHVVLLVPRTVPDQPQGAIRVITVRPHTELGTLDPEHLEPAAIQTLTANLTPTVPPPAPESAPPPNLLPTTDPSPISTTTTTRALRDDGPRHSSVLPAITGGVFVALGLGGIATAWVFYGQRAVTRAHTSQLHSLTYAERAEFRSAGTTALWFGLAGSLFLAAGEYPLLPAERTVPTTGWILGGAGALLAASGLVFAVKDNHCSRPSLGSHECSGFTADATFGPLLLLHAIPLLSVPLNYALREWFRPRRRIELGFDGHKATLSWHF